MKLFINIVSNIVYAAESESFLPDFRLYGDYKEINITELLPKTKEQQLEGMLLEQKETIKTLKNRIKYLKRRLNK